jgi:membrane peptidoglycan carboxypeptidase
MSTEDSRPADGNETRSLSQSAQLQPTRQEKALRYLERKHARDTGNTHNTDDTDDTTIKINTPPTKFDPTTPIPLMLAKVETTPTPAVSRPKLREQIGHPLQHASSLFQSQTGEKNTASDGTGNAQDSTDHSLTQPLQASQTGVVMMHQTPVAPISSIEARRALQRQRYRKVLIRHYVRKNLRQARVEQHQISQRFWITVGSVFFAFCFIFFSVTGTGAYATWRFYDDTQTRYLPRIATLQDLMPLDNLKIYDHNGVMLDQLTDQGMHTSVALKDVAPDLVKATVATEDKNFWQNSGVDIPRIIQAALDDLRSGHVVAGGSTITQQLIKNMVVGNETTIERKLAEVMLTPELNRRYTKNDIMEMYLNSIYYGEQAYGTDAAATVYFGLTDKPGKPAAKQLDLAQSAMLAGLPQYPYGYDPFQHPQAALQRFQQVLDLMVTQGDISRVQELDAIREAHSPNFFKHPDLTNRAPHFVNFVLQELEQEFNMRRNQLSRSDMQVYTTLDINLQDKIQKIAQQHVAELRDAHHVTNAAEVLIDFHTGAIRSLLGSIDYNDKSIDGQYDVATQSYRQPGSSFKPYVYVAAFEQGASPGQAIDDSPLTINLPGQNPPTFNPTNYDEQYHGHMTLRCALQNSLNVPAVKVLQHVGIDTAMSMAHSMGVTTYRGYAGYSLVLGGIGVRLIDHTSAYGTFADGGMHVPYYAVQKVVFNRTHQTIMHQQDPGTRVISPQLAYMMTNVLSDNQSRLPEFFDCNPLQLYNNAQTDCWYGDRGTIRPAAAKTGTTNDFRDNWTMGYTTDYVMGVWVGNDDNTPMYNVTGVQGAAPIWHDSMLVAEQGMPVRNFVYPGGLDKQTVTYGDGVKTTDWFLPGTEPSQVNLNPSPTAISIPGLTPTPTPPNKHKQDNGNQSSTHPYCPNDFSFAFNPPSSSNNNTGDQFLNPGWW